MLNFVTPRLQQSIAYRFRLLSRRQFWFSLLLILGLSLSLLARFPEVAAAQAPIASGPGTEIRGVWLTNIDSDVLFSKANLRQALDRLARLNFNTIYPTVWNGGYTLYPSKVAERISGQLVDPMFKDRDMLKEAIEMGHNRKLTVIPWFEFGLMAPAESELVQRHPDWVTMRRDGNSIFHVHGDDNSVWLNPMHPQVQQFLVDLIVEAIQRYDLDGIQLDDHFGMPVEVGYDPYTAQLYQLENPGQALPNNPRDPAWMQWRASKLSELMVRIYSAVRTHKPNCIISLAPNPKDFSYANLLQDWMSWQRLGFIDELIVQVYRDSLDRFTGEIDRPELQAIRSQVPVGIGILTGLRFRNVQTQWIQDQVRLARARQYAGVSFFFYESLGNRDAVYQALFPNPAGRPNVQTFRAQAKA